ncbi:hypothetical protein [Azospirillum sp. sgz302134]
MQPFVSTVTFSQFPFGDTKSVKVADLASGDVLFHGVAMAGFLNTFSSGHGYGEGVGSFQARAVPNLVNNTIYVTTTGSLTDFDDDAQGMLSGGDTTPFQGVFTVLGITGAASSDLSTTNQVTVGNVYNVISQDSAGFSVTINGPALAMIAGVSFQANGSSSSVDISGCYASVHGLNSSGTSEVQTYASMGVGGLYCIVDTCICALTGLSDFYWTTGTVSSSNSQNNGTGGAGASYTFSWLENSATGTVSYGAALTAFNMSLFSSDGSPETRALNKVGVYVNSLTSNNSSGSITTTFYLTNDYHDDYQSSGANASYAFFLQTNVQTAS